ncbi:MAG: SDR family oxidoreductase [Planctomycetota bacterium]|nr:SDR family oxidoreductase [Planctomycetota bacterium]
MSTPPAQPSHRQPLALVTGASQGIGAAVARALHAAGARVVVSARRLGPCESLAEELGEGAHALSLDVTDAVAVAALPARLEAEHGPLDWLVNNAGAATSAPLGKSDEALYQRLMELNFHAARRLAGAFLPGMRERDHGRIVAVASSAGLVGYPYVAAYCASKHALIGYTRAAAAETDKTGVGFGAVCPHYVDTPLLAASIDNLVAKTGKTRDEARAFFADQNPGGRLVAPAEVAAAVVELCQATGRGIVELDGGPARLVD